MTLLIGLLAMIEGREATQDPLVENSEKNEQVFRIKQQKCGVCDMASSKYRCPRCDMLTCSLPCVTSHKEKFSCTGKRNRAEFVSLSKFTDSTLYSDYTLLTDISHQISIQPKKFARIRPKPSLYTYRWQLLRKIATQQNIRLQLLPVLSSRRRENTTIFDKKKQAILWRVEWVCQHVPTGKVILYSDKVEDTRMVGEVLFSLIHNTPLAGKELDFYFGKEPDIENWKVLMKVEHRPANDPKYYDLTLNCNFRENLAGKDVIEFPTLLVVLPEHLSLYKIQATDREHMAQEPEYFGNPDDIQIEENNEKTELPSEFSQDVLDILHALLKDATGSQATGSIVTETKTPEVIDVDMSDKTNTPLEMDMSDKTDTLGSAPNLLVAGEKIDSVVTVTPGVNVTQE